MTEIEHEHTEEYEVKNVDLSKKVKNMNLFLKIFYFLKNRFTNPSNLQDPEQVPITKKDDSISEKENPTVLKSSEEIFVDKLIANNMFKTVQQYIDNGYILNDNQEIEYKVAMFDKLKKEKFPFYEYLNQNNIFIDDTVFLFYFIHFFSKEFKSNENKENLRILSDEFKARAYCTEFQKKIFHTFNSILDRQASDINKDYKIYKYEKSKYYEDTFSLMGLYLLKYCIDTIEPYEYFSLIEQIKANKSLIEKKNRNEEKYHFNTLIEQHLNAIEKSIQNIEKMFDESFSNSLKDNHYYNIQKNDSNHNGNEKSIFTIHEGYILIGEQKIKVNNKIINTLHNICDMYENCIYDKGSLSENDLKRIHQLFNTEIPNLLLNYSSLENSSNKKLVNVEGKTSSDLLEESLTNILDIIETKMDIINDKKMSELSVRNRYIASMKKSF